MQNEIIYSFHEIVMTTWHQVILIGEEGALPLRLNGAASDEPTANHNHETKKTYRSDNWRRPRPEACKQ